MAQPVYTQDPRKNQDIIRRIKLATCAAIRTGPGDLPDLLSRARHYGLCIYPNTAADGGVRGLAYELVGGSTGDVRGVRKLCVEGYQFTGKALSNGTVFYLEIKRALCRRQQEIETQHAPSKLTVHPNQALGALQRALHHA